MRVGIDATSWADPRGYGRFTREIIRALLARGSSHEIRLFIDEPSAAETELPAGEWITVPTRIAPTVAASASGNRTIRDLLSMTRAVARHSLDAVFFPTVYTWFPTWNRAPVILGVHDVIAEDHSRLIFPEFRQRVLWKTKCRLAHSRADWIMTVSEHSKSGILRHFRHDPDRIHVVPEAPSEVFRKLDEIDDAVLARWGIDAQTRFLVYVGGMNPHKNLRRLVEAFHRARAAGTGFELLLLVGETTGDRFTPGYHAIESEIESRKLEERVRFTGFVPDSDLVHVLNAAAVLVLPSLDEGYGLPAIEAAACGTPVIATRNSPLPSVLEGGGVFIDPTSTDALIDAIRSLDDRVYADSLGREAQRRALRLSWRGSADELEHLFDRVAESRAGVQEP